MMENGAAVGSWAAIATGLGLFGMGLSGLLYNLGLLTSHLWCLWVISALAMQLMHAVPGRWLPGSVVWMAVLNLSGGGLLLTIQGWRRLPSPAPLGAGESRRQFS